MQPTEHRSLASGRRWALRLAFAALLVIVVALAAKTYLIAVRAQTLRADLQELAALTPRLPNTDALAELAPLLARSRRDAAALRAEAAPLLPLSDQLGWVPRYGPTLRAARPLVSAAADLSLAADEGYTALAPLLDARDAGRPLGPALANELTASRARLVAAREALGRADDALNGVPIDSLAAPLREPLARVGPLLPLAEDGADMALALPDLLGASEPRTYLVLAQNPDELRPTGGLITAAGTVTVDDGMITSAVLTDSGVLDDPSRYVYPAPPLPLQHYMGMELWLFRDANWSPDFPIAARQALTLYSVAHATPINGVVALNPAAIELLLAAAGPVTLPGHQQPIDATNVLAFMRDGTPPQPGDTTPWAVRRKAFLPPLTRALLDRLAGSAKLDPAAVAGALRRALNERHIQVYLADPAPAAVFARRGWDGAVRPGVGDYLMLVDANLGYNKANMHIRQDARYSLDLSDPAAPSAELTLRYTHRLDQDVPCDQSSAYLAVWRIRSYDEWAAGCYWNELRVLVPGATRLISATAEPVPAEWMDSRVGDDGGTALEPAENGAAALRTFLVVPAGGERTRTFHYTLPASVVTHQGDLDRYHLFIQKQAGVPPTPFVIELRLPAGATLVQSSLPPAAGDHGVLRFTLDLARDQALDLTFSAAPSS